jgi:hypothetical protein
MDRVLQKSKQEDVERGKLGQAKDPSVTKSVGYIRRKERSKR